MIKQIRPSLVALYINEEMNDELFKETYESDEIIPQIKCRVERTFNICKEFEYKIKLPPMNPKQLENKVTDLYCLKLEQNVLSMKRI